MLKLNKGDILYHASYTEIKNIEISLCSKGKDFGQGFYLTKDFVQAQKFVKSGVNKAKLENKIPVVQDYGFVNIYKVSDVTELLEFDFDTADKDWLHYVSGNRNGSLFSDIIQELSGFNVIGGKIANDQTAATLNLYINYAYGTPGSREADDFCIRKLLPDRLSNQYCFKTREAVDSLIFTEAVKVKL